MSADISVRGVGQAGNRRTGLIERADLPHFFNANTRHFGFRHTLAEHALFKLSEIAALARRIPDFDGFKYWQNGTVKLTDGWNTGLGKRLTLGETIEGIAETDSVVVLKHVEQDPIFGPMLRELLQQVFEAAPPAFRNEVLIGECLIFLNSPNRKTAYHFDLEPSFLLQVRGEKEAFAWPNGDPTLTPEEELEAFCAGEQSAGKYKPDRQKDATLYKLSPGDGVHFPSTGPHWVQNGPDVSISVNVNFDMRSSHRTMKHAYKINHKLRRLGLRPTPAGTRPWLDAAKAGVWLKAHQARRLMQSITGRTNPADTYPVWTPQREAVGRSMQEPGA